MLTVSKIFILRIFLLQMTINMIICKAMSIHCFDNDSACQYKQYYSFSKLNIFNIDFQDVNFIFQQNPQYFKKPLKQSLHQL